MRKLISMALIIALLLMSSSRGEASLVWNGGGNWLVTGNQTAIAGHFPMTVAAFVYTTSFSGSGNQGVVVGHGGQSNSNHSWGYEAWTSGSGCGSGGHGPNLIKWTIIGICSSSSTVQMDLNTWELMGVVITSTKVHFFKVVANGTFAITTNDVNDSNGFASGTSAVPALIGVENSSNATGAVCRTCKLAGIVVWDTLQATDAQLVNYAKTCDPTVVGKPDAFWPLDYNTPNQGTIPAPVYQWPDYSGKHNPAGIHDSSNNSFLTGPNPPCVPPIMEGKSPAAF